MVTTKRSNSSTKLSKRKDSASLDLASHFASMGMDADLEYDTQTASEDSAFFSCPEIGTTVDRSTEMRRRSLELRQKVQRVKQPRRVSFGAVEVREFERVLDVHPSCSHGPSLSIGWNYEPKDSVKLEQWEKRKKKATGGISSFDFFVRKGADKPLFMPSEVSPSLRMSQEKREELAKKFGYSEEDIAKNVRKIERAQVRRRKSLEEDKKEHHKEVRRQDPKSLMVQLYRLQRNEAMSSQSSISSH